MDKAEKAFTELKEAERHLLRALDLVGMYRGREGYVAPSIALALENIRDVKKGMDVYSARKRGWSRLARH